MDLNILWFILLGVLLAGYAILDGFDLGVGMLHPFVARTDHDRRIVLNSIGPIWDGNEVWLVTFGGAMFAAFPEAYATIFSGFYLAFMVVLFALIFRAVSIEFRSKVHSRFWRTTWDYAFAGSSFLATLVFGIAVGAAIEGVPLNRRGVPVGSFIDQLGPYPLAVGLLAVVMFLMHGAIYLHLKTEGELQRRVRRAMWGGFAAFATGYAVVSVWTIVTIPNATKNFSDHPWAWGLVVLNVLAVANIPRTFFFRRTGWAFLSSAATIAALVCLVGLALFPDLVTSRPHPENSLTIYSAASSQKTLAIMAWIAVLGMPFVLAYTGIVYWTFRGKVRLEDHSY